MSRDAVDTITGYFYQFDKTILDILNQTDLDKKIKIEGIEDIDIYDNDELTAIQCKYYSKTVYNHSVIKDPIILMIKHFSEASPSGANIRYHLYGHFKSGQNKLDQINIDILKSNFLTYKKTISDGKGGKIIEEHRVYDELGLDDSALQIFLNQLSLNINAPSFEDQYSEIIEKIKIDLSVNNLEAESYHYNSALKTIKDLSIQQIEQNRAITKREFINIIQAKDEIFDSWFIRRKGKNSYIQSIKKQKLSNSLNMEAYNRFFLIDCSDYNNLSEIKEIIYMIAKKWSKISNRAKPCFCPSIYLHGLNDGDQLEIKEKMYTEGYVFIDGYPYYNAKVDHVFFYTPPSADNKIKFRFVNSTEDLDVFLENAEGTVELYEFYIKDRFFKFDDCIYKAIKIEDLSYIKDMVK